MTIQTIKIDDLLLDGGTQPRAAYWLADGFHRVEAAKTAGRSEIEAVVKQGAQADAQWHACAVNGSHGLPRSRADVRRAIETAIRLRPTMSDREVAEHVRCNHETVGSRRKALAATGGIRQSPIRTGRDGRKINTAAIGTRQKATEPEQPAIVPCMPEPESNVIFTRPAPAHAFEPHDPFTATLAAVLKDNAFEALTAENADLRRQVADLTAELEQVRKKPAEPKAPRFPVLADDDLRNKFHAAVPAKHIKPWYKRNGCSYTTVRKWAKGLSGMGPTPRAAISYNLEKEAVQ